MGEEEPGRVEGAVAAVTRAGGRVPSGAEAAAGRGGPHLPGPHDVCGEDMETEGPARRGESHRSRPWVPRPGSRRVPAGVGCLWPTLTGQNRRTRVSAVEPLARTRGRPGLGVAVSVEMGLGSQGPTVKGPRGQSAPQVTKKPSEVLENRSVQIQR